MLIPAEVFTPGRPPVRQNNVYVGRGEAEKSLEKALSRSYIPVVFGEFGVGKTSLARHVLAEAEQAGRLVNVETVSGCTFRSVIEQLLEAIGYRVDANVSRTTSSTKSEGLAAEFGTTDGSSGIGWVAG